MNKLSVLAALLAVLTALSLTACSREPISRTGFLLSTVVSVTLYDGGDEALLDEAFALCGAQERIFSRTDPQSEVSALNNAGGAPVAVSPELLGVLRRALDYSRKTGGKYDVTICPVVDLWDFSAAAPTLPPPEALTEALAKVGWQNIVIEGDTVRLANGAQIDLGSIAKGYIADRMARFLRENGVKSAMLDLGGDLVTVGGKPEGAPFRVGVQKPASSYSTLVGTIAATDLAVASSGVYERTFTLDGVEYHHILDTVTGYPAKTGLAGVTVVCDQAMEADALATCIHLLGVREGLRFAQEAGVAALLITTEGEEYFTPGFAEQLDYRAAGQ